MFLEGRSGRRADAHSSWTVLSQHVAQTGSCPLAWWWWWWCHSSGGGRSAGDSVGDGDGDGAGGTAAPPFLSLTSAPLPCPQILGHFDIAFTSVFTVEIVLKVSGGRGTAWPWGTSRPGAQTGGGSSLPQHSLRGRTSDEAKVGGRRGDPGPRTPAGAPARRRGGRAAVEPGRAAVCSPAPPARRGHVCAARRFLLPVEGSVCPESPRELSSFPRPSLP